LRMRGHDERADGLMTSYRRLASSQPAEPVPATAANTQKPISSRDEAPVATSTLDLPPSGPPRLLAIGTVDIHRSQTPPSDHPDQRAIAGQLSMRGRHREALEYLVQASVSVAPELARAAAQEYIQQGLLRSADAVYDALNEPQIPEFYKAVAVEWSRQEGAPPEPVLRLAKLLEQMNEPEVAARISCQGVLSNLGSPLARRNLALLAVELCQRLGQDPPPEVLEAVERFVAAGDAYRRLGDEASARRCYETIADRLLPQLDQRELLIPVLNRMFKLDKFLDERFMAPLVNDVLNNGSSGPQAQKILTTYRARNRDDHKVTVRLFELMVQDGNLEEALKLLREMSLMTGSHPDSVLQHFELLRRRFPDDMRIEIGRTRALIKAGRVQDGAQELQQMLSRINDPETAQEMVMLVESVFEWGHPDPELRNAAGRMLARIGDHEAALSTFEQYVSTGGRDPAAIAKAESIIGGRLALDSGAPDHAAHLRMARFQLSSGSPQEAIPFLEVARASADHRVEADLLLARAEVAASNPRRAVQVLRDAIDGRHPRDTPELHYELARVYDLLGDRKKARQIDHALEQYVPDAVRSYQEERPILEKRDTEWVPSDHADPLVSAGDTDVGGAPLTGGGPETQATYVEDEQTITLEEALAPRYRLSKRLGAGGMGDVHLARDEMLGRPVAIKVLRRTLATDLFISKFRDEARIVAKLSHPGIVSVYDIGQKRDWSYIVMEYVRGPNLSALVNASSPPSRHHLVHYVAAVADAMSYAHEEGVIHRDLKPANILIATDGKVKVTDFGIAHVLQGEGNEETAFSAAGLQVGTVNYMAPEQLQGRPIDRRTDIYLLGTTLYYTLCRRYPFMGEAVAVRKLREAPMPLSRYVPDISPELESCVRRCISKEPGDRFQRMENLAEALRQVPEALVA
ncbi:MAG: protein kinase, partial [Myxococcota bacterium]